MFKLGKVMNCDHNNIIIASELDKSQTLYLYMWGILTILLIFENLRILYQADLWLTEI